MGAIKKNQFLIGFALETENEIENAKLKIQKKNLDLIVLNSLQDKGAGFKKETNKVTFIDENFEIEPMELKSKESVAADILNKVILHFSK
ncbi:bifunctional phosphopantothenoylcysteine decarboxylase/phosphopantothenate synthase [compost metagenome]